MDQNPTNQPTPHTGKTPSVGPGPIIRTMAKDIESAEKGTMPGPGAGPAGVPAYGPSETTLGLGITPPPPGETAGRPMTPAPLPPPPINAPAGIPVPPLPGELEGELPLSHEETVISEKALTEFAPPQPPKKDVKKLAMIAGIAGGVIVLGFLGGWFLYPRFFPKPTPTPTLIITPIVTPIPSPTATPLPTPIVFFQTPPDKTAVLSVTAEQTKPELVAAINKELKQTEPAGTLKILDLRQNGEPLTFDRFATLLGLNFPTELKTLISPEFRLYINTNAQEGSRIGLVLFVSDPAIARPAISAWESTIPADLAAIYLEADKGTLAQTVFKDADYRSVAKRYLTFSKTPYSIDYALYQNFLIIGTSRFSFATAVDRILGPAPVPMP